MKRRTQTGPLLAGATLGTLIALTPIVSAQDRKQHGSLSDGVREPAPIPQPRPEEKKKKEDPPPKPGPGPDGTDMEIPQEFRTINGTNNNLANPLWGSADIPFLRLAPAEYADGTGAPAGPARPSTRAISNAVCAQSELIENIRCATDYLWQWGQFLDHDIDETPGANPEEPFPIPVPADDFLFDPTGSGTEVIPLNRSAGEEINGVREQFNIITAYIDASNVYGSDEERAFALRTLDGTGRLKVTVTEVGDLLPYNVAGLHNAPADTPNFFLAGDIRANEQAGLAAMHTLFVREHNYWADQYRELNPLATGQETYEFARIIVAAEMQVITYREFLPVLLGKDALPPYEGYRPEVDASITNVFATASYRLGHSLLSPTLLRLDAAGQEIEAGHLPLADAFFDPSLLETEGIDSILRGLAAQKCQALDEKIVDGVRNFLFGPPGAGGFDLPALNMQRGRDHGLPTFAGMCSALNLQVPQSFTDINPDPEVAANLASVYSDVTEVDAWVGGLCEPNVPDSMLGPMFHEVVREQFIRLRDGDRFFYKNYLSPELQELVERQTLAKIIRRNTNIGDEIQKKVFVLKH